LAEVVNVPNLSVAPAGHYAYLGVPIRRNGTSLGAFEVVDTAGRCFGTDEVDLVISLASGIAIGVTGARETSELDQEERRLVAVVEQLPSGVLVLDVDGRPVLVNGACRRIFGRLDTSRPVIEQAAGLDLEEAHGGERIPLSALLDRVLGGDSIHGYEAKYRPVGAEIEYWLQASAVPLRDSAAHIGGAVVVITDVTPERRLAGELAATVRQNLYLHGALAESERRLGGLIERLLRGQTRGVATTDAQVGGLTRREREVLGLLGEGKSTADMARELQLSVSTVRLHVKHVLAKLGVSSRTQAALRARELLGVDGQG
jgi:PAS domain S-box-containing protein